MDTPVPTHSLLMRTKEKGKTEKDAIECMSSSITFIKAGTASNYKAYHGQNAIKLTFCSKEGMQKTVDILKDNSPLLSTQSCHRLTLAS